MPNVNIDRDIGVLDLSLPKVSTSSDIGGQALNVSLPNVMNNECNVNGHESKSRTNTNSLQLSDGSSSLNISHFSQFAVNDLSQFQSNTNTSQSRLLIVASTSSKDIAQIKLPHKRVSKGRPKGSSTTTAIGTKRKRISGSTRSSIKKVKVNL